MRQRHPWTRYRQRLAQRHTGRLRLIEKSGKREAQARPGSRFVCRRKPRGSVMTLRRQPPPPLLAQCRRLPDCGGCKRGRSCQRPSKLVWKKCVQNSPPRLLAKKKGNRNVLREYAVGAGVCVGVRSICMHGAGTQCWGSGGARVKCPKPLANLSPHKVCRGSDFAIHLNIHHFLGGKFKFLSTHQSTSDHLGYDMCSDSAWTLKAHYVVYMA